MAIKFFAQRPIGRYWYFQNFKKFVPRAFIYIPNYGMWCKTQYTAVEVQTSRKISKARIHMERSIGQLKGYKILKNKVPYNILPYLSKIMFICCQLTNLKSINIKAIQENFIKGY